LKSDKKEKTVKRRGGEQGFFIEPWKRNSLKGETRGLYAFG